MTVIKKYNTGTSAWETIVVGRQGPPGPAGPAGPAGSIDILTDVTVTSPQDGQILVYDNADSLWKNQNIPPISILDSAVLKSVQERWNIDAAAATGTVNVDIVTSSAWYYTSNSTANWTLNFRGNSGTTLSSLVSVGDSVTIAFAATIGATQYRPTAFQIDGVAVTPLFQDGSAPTDGNVNSVDVYMFNIVKTAATPTYKVFASQTQFA